MNLCWFGKKNISTRQHGAFPKPSQCPRQLVGFWIMTFALQPARGFLCHLLSPCIFSLNCGVTTLSHKGVKQCAYKAECQQCPGRACHGGGWPSSPVSRPVFYNPVAMRSQTWCCPRGKGSIREKTHFLFLYSPHLSTNHQGYFVEALETLWLEIKRWSTKNEEK